MHSRNSKVEDQKTVNMYKLKGATRVMNHAPQFHVIFKLQCCTINFNNFHNIRSYKLIWQFQDQACSGFFFLSCDQNQIERNDKP